jgi:hypothetical protein
MDLLEVSAGAIPQGPVRQGLEDGGKAKSQPIPPLRPWRNRQIVIDRLPCLLLRNSRFPNCAQLSKS